MSCRHCGHDISIRATRCPKCGHRGEDLHTEIAPSPIPKDASVFLKLIYFFEALTGSGDVSSAIADKIKLLVTLLGAGFGAVGFVQQSMGVANRTVGMVVVDAVSGAIIGALTFR